MLAVLAAYANHFQNDFHFDDFHTITTNVFIEDLRNIPRFFADAALFTAKPGGATYRPVTSASLALDYWLGHGRKPFFFHLSTFLWFVLQLILMFFLFRRIMDLADPHPSNTWTAWLAAACYGLHPANAETVNYIIQRADLYSTLGVVASLLWFVRYPEQRKRGWYLLPAVAAYLAKAPALIYPLILLAYVFLFEQDANRKKWAAAIRATLPVLAVTAAAAILIAGMTPATFDSGAASASLYRLTQPWVALHYFKCFFLPTDLSADSNWDYVSGPFSGEALAGYLFVAALVAAALRTARQRETRPICFGIVWFFLALLPTSLMPLADVTNDHRMFFPFVGLALTVFWSLRLLLFRQTARLTAHRAWLRAAIAGAVVVLAAAAAGTHERNEVWRTDESLWRDVTVKSPENGRGLMGYATVFLNRGDYATAIDYLERAKPLLPNYSGIEINLGIAYGATGRDAEAAQHFELAAQLAPGVADPHFYYGRWLASKGRLAEAQAQLETAVRFSPLSFPARNVLLEVYSEQGNQPAFDALVQETLRLGYNEETARRYAEESARIQKAAATPQQSNPQQPDPQQPNPQQPTAPQPNPQQAANPQPAIPQNRKPEALLNLSAKYCNEGNYAECLALARQALDLRPGYAEAYNNMAAAYNSMEQWDEAIRAASEAVRLKPDYPVARKNLDWARTHRRQAQNGGR